MDKLDEHTEADAIRRILAAVAEQAVYDYAVLRSWGLITDDDNVRISAWPRRHDGMFRYLLDGDYTPAECARLLDYLRRDRIALSWAHRAYRAVRDGHGHLRSMHHYKPRARRVTNWLSPADMDWCRSEAERLGGRIIETMQNNRRYIAVEV